MNFVGHTRTVEEEDRQIQLLVDIFNTVWKWVKNSNNGRELRRRRCRDLACLVFSLVLKHPRSHATDSLPLTTGRRTIHDVMLMAMVLQAYIDGRIDSRTFFFTTATAQHTPSHSNAADGALECRYL